MWFFFVVVGVGGVCDGVGAGCDVVAVRGHLEAPRAQKPKKGAKEVMDTHDGELPNGQSFKRKKGRAGAGKMKKVTKARGK